jgi:L-methionine (R)-S-oxide reductase
VAEVFEFTRVQGQTKAEFYDTLVEYTKHLIDGETDEIANLSNVSALLNEFLEDINWVGFYLWSNRDNELILGPFQGKPACIRIPSGKGVCGTAVATGETQVVRDVHAFPGHIACDAASRSEIVIPLYKHERLIGVLDIDSPSLNRFDEEDAQGLKRVMAVLVDGTEFRDR